MSAASIAELAGRGVIAVEGPDAKGFLDNLITNDMDRLKGAGDAIFAALLTPQGKILFDFFVVQTGSGYLLDVARDKAAELAKRLTFYKLRAKVTVEDRSGDFGVAAVWPVVSDLIAGTSISYADPRNRVAGARVIFEKERETLENLARALGAEVTDRADYERHRIGLGTPDGGADFAYGDAFPHEANMDALDGVDFQKGCFVGQEVVARMQHKTVVRKRVVPIKADGPLASGAEINVGEAVIGTVGTVAGSEGLALLRLDRVVEALDKGQPITCGGAPVTVDDARIKAYREAVANRPVSAL
jgi:folate-binding protein YgfZ